MVGAMDPRQPIRGEVCWQIRMGEGPGRGGKTFALPFKALHEALNNVAAYMGYHVGTAAWRLEDMIENDGSTQPKRRECLWYGSECLVKTQQHIIGRTPLLRSMLDTSGTVACLRASAVMCIEKRRRLHGE
jgi:hypothetical protein